MSTIFGRSPRRTRSLGLLGVALATGLSGALGLVDTASAADTTSQYGSVSADDATLPAANTCGTYSYAYDVTPPPGTWILETTVTDPRGNNVASYAAVVTYSPGGGHSRTSFQLCRNNTAPGIFTITAKMTVSDDADRSGSTYQMTPDTFVMIDAPRAAKNTKHKKHKKRHHRKNRSR